MKTTHLAAERITVELTEFELTALAALVERAQHSIRYERRGNFEIHEAIDRVANEFRSLLDSSCGIGQKSVVLAEMGYEVEASAASEEAVRITAEHARLAGLSFPVIRSRWEELGSAGVGSFDAVYNDALDLVETKEALLASARGFHAVLRDGGLLLFPGAHQWFSEAEREEVIEETWQSLPRIGAEAPVVRGDVRLSGVYVHDRVEEGVLVNVVLLWEEGGRAHAEIALDWIVRFRWSWPDLASALSEAGFREVFSARIDGYPARAPYIANIAVK